MKKVLIITEFFPPTPIVGGLRMAMFSKYLPEHDWEPYILTSKTDEEDKKKFLDIEELPPENNQLRVKYALKEKEQYQADLSIIDRIKGIYAPELTNPPGAYRLFKRNADAFIGKISPDIILASAPTLFPIRVAKAMAEKYKIPWIADFRDIIEEARGEKDGLKETIRFIRTKNSRNRMIQKANRIITISKYLQEILQKQVRRKVDIIHNGYDDSVFYPRKKFRANSKLTITYAGRLMSEFFRNPTILFAAIKELTENGTIPKDQIEVNFYGTEKEKLETYITQFKLHGIVNLKERILYSKVPELLSKSDVLLVLTNHNRKGVLTTKLFEYMGVEKFVLCVPSGSDEMDEVIRKANVGKTVRNVDEAKECLANLFNEWKQKGEIAISPNSDYIKGFGRKALTGKLANILDSVIAKTRS